MIRGKNMTSVFNHDVNEALNESRYLLVKAWESKFELYDEDDEVVQPHEELRAVKFTYRNAPACFKNKYGYAAGLYFYAGPLEGTFACFNDKTHRWELVLVSDKTLVRRVVRQAEGPHDEHLLAEAKRCVSALRTWEARSELIDLLVDLNDDERRANRVKTKTR